MIPADEPFVAVFETDDGVVEKRVIAWDDLDHPLIAGPDSLVAAYGEAGFKRIREAPELRRAVGTLPAGGWRVRWKDGTDWVSEPLIGWVVFSDGAVVPMEHAGQGGVMIPSERRDEGSFQIYHPDTEAPDVSGAHWH